MFFFAIFIGIVLGHFLIGGTLSFFFSPQEPEHATENIYAQIGKVVGAIIAAAIYSNM